MKKRDRAERALTIVMKRRGVLIEESCADSISARRLREIRSEWVALQSLREILGGRS